MSRLTDAFHARCPYCKTLFRVRPEHLAIAEGRVRCGQCFSVFLAEEHLAMSAPARGEFAAGPLPSGVLNELGEAYQGEEGLGEKRPNEDLAADPVGQLAPRRVTASVSTRLAEPEAPASFTAPPSHELPVQAIAAEPDERSWRVETEDEPEDAAPFPARDEDDEAALTARAASAAASYPALDDFDPDDEAYAIDDALLDDSVLGPLPARQEPRWLDEPEVEELLNGGTRSDEDEDAALDTQEARFASSYPEDDAGTAETEQEQGAEAAPPGTQPFQDEELEDELAEVLERRPESPLRLFAWGLGSLVLLALLAGQLFWAYRDNLAQNPAWRSYAEQACALLGCRLQPMRDVASIQLGASALKPNPAQAGAFDVHLMLLNRAAFAQPYPAIELAFTSLEGKRLAVRRFRPEEYLAPEMIGRPMPSGTPVHVRFAIVAPDANASGFEFRFFE
ncbi:MAG: DUF3426 domain-containing protein [Gammaproteobacteria bacterium]|nr:DUF3426 domain-containing protein [Gammaproteobacteria bacterium]